MFNCTYIFNLEIIVKIVNLNDTQSLLIIYTNRM